MYSGDSITALALRAKSSLYTRLPIGCDQRCCHHSHYHPRHQSLCYCCNYRSSCSIPVNPRLLSSYYFAQYRGINWEPRRFLLAAAAYHRIGSFWDAIDSLANVHLAQLQVNWEENVEFKRKRKKKRDRSSEELRSESSDDLSSDYEVEKGRHRRSGGESKCRCSCREHEYEKERRVRKSRRGGSGGASSSRRAYEYEVSDWEENEEDFEESGRNTNEDRVQKEHSYQDVHRRRDRAREDSEKYRWQRDSTNGSKKEIRLSEVHEDDRRMDSNLRDCDEEVREVYTRRYNRGRTSNSRCYDEDGREDYTQRDDRGSSKLRAYDEEVREGCSHSDDRGRPSNLRDYKKEVTEDYTRRDRKGTASNLRNYNEEVRENYTKGDNRGRASKLINYNEEVPENNTRRDDRARASKLGDYNEEVREDYTRRNDRRRASKFEDNNEYVAEGYGHSNSRRTARTSEIHEDYRDSGSWIRFSDHLATEEQADEQLGTHGKGAQKVIRKSEVDDRKITSRLKDSAQSEKDVYINEERDNLAKRASEDVAQRSARTAEVREAHKNLIASSSNLVNLTVVNKEESSASAAGRGHQTTESATSSQNCKNMSDISDSYIKRASLSRKKFDETRVNDREDTLVEVRRDRRTLLNIKEVENIDVNLQKKARANLSSIYSTDNQNQYTKESQINDQEHHARTVKEHCEREELSQTGGQLIDRGSIEEADRNTPRFQLLRSNTGRISTYQETAGSTSDETFNEKVESQEQCSSPVQPKICRSITERTLNSQGPINSNVQIQEEYLSLARDNNENTLKGSTVNGTTSQLGESQTERRGSLIGGSGSLNRSRSEEDNDRSGDDTNQIGDLLESARISQESSEQHVEEFVKRLQQELSTSDDLSNPSEQYPGILVKETNKGEAAQSSCMGIAGHAGTPEFKDGISIQNSERQSSSMSEPEGPSEEMWIAKSVSSKEQDQREALEEENSPGKDSTNVSEGTEIARRGPKSLWAYIAQVIRMGWRTSGGTQSPLSGIRSSSHESLDSEAWFSGNELDDNDVTEKERKVMSQLAGLSKSKSEPPTKVGLDVGGRDHMEELSESRTSALASSTRKGPTSECSSPIAPSNEVVPLEAAVATSMSSGKSGRTFGGASQVTGSNNVNLLEIERDQQVIHADTETVSHSALLTGTTSSASAPETITETETPGSASAKFDKLKAAVSAPDAQPGELKQRKLQKSKQVMQEQFDEWEEAYKQESERQKLDEFFMREALLEAKKAADMWEVPVGAVLVQNGKIVARGCNLVEELRDSTAHAEMLCIREASNLLRTWRLAGTTLYVTLEPCPMCAGAILQARIDTVVWGAPNKLLGADGSWVRLFPGNGGSDLDAPNRTVGPVHPFHTKITIRRGVLSEECANAMQQFFQLRRKKDKKADPSTPTCLPLATHRPKFFTRMHNMFGIMFCL